MLTILLVIHIIITVSLVGLILLQRSSADGMAGLGGSGNNFLSGRGAANAMTRTTAVLATLFIINSLVLAVLASRTERDTSIIDKLKVAVPAVTEQPLTPAAAPEVPSVEKNDNSAPVPAVPFAQ